MSKRKLKNLILRAMQSTDSSISNIQDNQSITGYFGFDQVDIESYTSYVGLELSKEIDKSRMSTTIGDAVNYLLEITQNEKH